MIPGVTLTLHRQLALAKMLARHLGANVRTMEAARHGSVEVIVEEEAGEGARARYGALSMAYDSNSRADWVRLAVAIAITVRGAGNLHEVEVDAVEALFDRWLSSAGEMTEVRIYRRPNPGGVAGVVKYRSTEPRGPEVSFTAMPNQTAITVHRAWSDWPGPEARKVDDVEGWLKAHGMGVDDLLAEAQPPAEPLEETVRRAEAAFAELGHL